jgi:hypothetical protein
MSCFILLWLLDVCRWILVFILFMVIEGLKSCTPNICSQKGHVYYFCNVHFQCCLFRFVLFCFLSLSFCSLLVHFSLVVWGFFFFFPSINISLQQCTCTVFIKPFFLFT